MSTRRSTSRTGAGGRSQSEAARPSLVTSVPIPRARERTMASANRGLRARRRRADIFIPLDTGRPIRIKSNIHYVLQVAAGGLEKADPQRGASGHRAGAPL